MNKWTEIIEKALQLKQKRKFTEAFETLQPIIKEADAILESGKYQDTDEIKYVDINTQFEVILYLKLNEEKHEKTGVETISVKGTDDIPFAMLYATAGNILFDLRRYEDARFMLKKAIRWKPTDTGYWFEYAETYKAVGNMKGFLKATEEAYKCVFDKAGLARCQRNLAFALCEEEKWRKAFVILINSLTFDRHPMAIHEINYIEQTVPSVAKRISPDEMRKMRQKYPMTAHASELVIGILYSLGAKAMETKRYDTAEYYFRITYELTDDKKTKALLDECITKQTSNAT